MGKYLKDPRLKSGSRDGVACNQPNVHPNVQDAFMNAMMPNGIWLKAGQDWLGRTKECRLCITGESDDPGWLRLFGAKL